jgi:hypothetical protein
VGDSMEAGLDINSGGPTLAHEIVAARLLAEMF